MKIINLSISCVCIYLHTNVIRIMIYTIEYLKHSECKDNIDCHV